MNMFFKSIQRLCCIVLLLAALSPPPSHAYKITGKVLNGTAGGAQADVTIEVVNPRGGMQVEQQLHSIDGAFVIDNLSDTSHVYVIRAMYQGVSYPEIIRPAESDTTFYEITVYDTTSSFGESKVSIPHLMIRRSGEHYIFEIIYEIVNITNPPKTITDQPFTLYIPEDRVGINALYTMEFGLPIHLDPIATDTKGIYHIDSPLKPGATRVAVSFEVHAHEGSYEYRQILPYDMDSIGILLEDPKIQVTSGNIDLEKTEIDQGRIMYSASSLAEESILAFRVSGGSTAAEPPPAQGMQIITQSKATEGGSVLLILIVAVLLFALPILSSGKPKGERPRSGIIETRKNQLLAHITKLDDLYTAGTVAETLYQAKRAELKNRLAYLLQQTGAHKTKSSRKSKRSKKEP
jgi:hypothetical protein